MHTSRRSTLSLAAALALFALLAAVRTWRAAQRLP